MSMEKRDLIPRAPQGVLRWVGRVGMLVYIPAIAVPIALALLIRRWSGPDLTSKVENHLLAFDEPALLLALGAIGALLVSVGIVNEIGRERIHKAWDVIRAMGATAVLGVLWTISPAVLGITLLVYLGEISIWLRDLGALGWLAYVALFVVSAGVGFLPTYGQSLLGGWVFGFLYGFPGAMIGFVGGSVIGYFISRRVSKHKVEELVESNEKARAIREALVGHGQKRTLLIVTLIRVPPNAPFALTNLILASSGVKLLPYVIGTAIGMAPRTAIVSYVASQAAKRAESIQGFIKSQPWWVSVVGLGITLLAFGVLYVIAEHALKAVTKKSPDAKTAG
jgi:uncharacterized membrane protein YdjX (TVP38/TMEM64 family)